METVEVNTGKVWFLNVIAIVMQWLCVDIQHYRCLINFSI